MNLHLGPLALQTAHLLALGCALLAMGTGWLVGRKRGTGIADVLFDMVLVAVPTGRAVFVGLWWSAYQDSPWSVFDIRDGGLEPWSALAAALLLAGWRVRQHPGLLRPLFWGLLVGFSAWSGVLAAGLNGQPNGAAPPSVRLSDLNGQALSLVAPTDGRAMVVNLWATWCPPCQREMPALARAQGLHPEVQFVFVNQGESLGVVQRYLRLVPFQLQRVLVDEDSQLGKALDSSALPMTLIYAPGGRLAYSHQGQISEAVLAMQLARCCQWHKTGI